MDEGSETKFRWQAQSASSHAAGFLSDHLSAISAADTAIGRDGNQIVLTGLTLSFKSVLANGVATTPPTNVPPVYIYLIRDMYPDPSEDISLLPPKIFTDPTASISEPHINPYYSSRFQLLWASFVLPPRYAPSGTATSASWPQATTEEFVDIDFENAPITRYDSGTGSYANVTQNALLFYAYFPEAGLGYAMQHTVRFNDLSQ